MSRRSFLLDLKAEGALALWHDYRRGDAQDMSGNGNHGVASADTIFGYEGAEFTTDTAVITVADAVSLQLTELTIAVYASFSNYERNGRMVSKRDAGGTNYEYSLGTADVVFIGAAAAATYIIGENLQGRKCSAVSAIHGSKAVGYTDGVSVGEYDAACALVADDAPLLIGNYYSAALDSFKDHMSAVVIANRVLTATEHAKLYGELANQDWGQLVL